MTDQKNSYSKDYCEGFDQDKMEEAEDTYLQQTMRMDLSSGFEEIARLEDEYFKQIRSHRHT